MRTTTTRQPPLHWDLRRRLSPQRRTQARRVVDRLGGWAIGSINGSASPNCVALTLDDGPDPDVTPGLLEVLHEQGVKATFFVLLSQVRRHPELLSRMAGEGHEIALHGRDHRRMTYLPHADAVAVLRSARSELEGHVGRRVRLYRPPFGSQSASTFLAARRAGLDVVAWSCDAADWVDRDVDLVVDAAMARLRPGGILLLHERLEPDPERDAPTTSFDRAEVLDRIIRLVTEKQWQPVTVSHLLLDAQPRRTVWLRP